MNSVDEVLFPARFRETGVAIVVEASQNVLEFVDSHVRDTRSHSLSSLRYITTNIASDEHTSKSAQTFTVGGAAIWEGSEFSASAPTSHAHETMVADSDYDKLTPEQREVRDKEDRAKEALEQASKSTLRCGCLLSDPYMQLSLTPGPRNWVR